MVLPKQKTMQRMLLFLFMFLPLLVISTNLDNDIWFLLNHGKYIFEKGFPTIEPFSIHSDFQFIIQQWLFSALVYLLHTIFGKWGIMLLVYVTAILVTVLLYKISMLLSDGKFLLSILLTTAVSLLFCAYYMVSRPQVVSYVIILFEIYALEKYVHTNRFKWLMLLPVLSLLLINFHSSMWWLLFAFMAPYIVGSIKIVKWNINTDPIKGKPLCITCVAMLVVGFLNPYGYRAITYLFSSFGDETISSSIMEMAVPDVKSLAGFIFYLSLVMVVFIYLFNRTGKTHIRFVLLTGGTCLLALMSIKGMAYYLIGTLLPLAFWMKNIAGKLIFKSTKGELGLVTMFMALIVIVSGTIIVDDYDSSKDFPETKAAIEYLAEQSDAKMAKVYTSFYDGGYAEYCGLKVYIDARAEVYIKANNKRVDVFKEYISLQTGNLHYGEFLEKYHFSHIIVSRSDVLDVYLSRDDNYAVYYENEGSRIFVPK